MIFRKNSLALSPSFDLIPRRSNCGERSSMRQFANVYYHHHFKTAENLVDYSSFFDLIFVRLGIYCRLELPLQSAKAISGSLYRLFQQKMMRSSQNRSSSRFWARPSPSRMDRCPVFSLGHIFNVQILSFSPRLKKQSENLGEK